MQSTAADLGCSLLKNIFKYILEVNAMRIVARDDNRSACFVVRDAWCGVRNE